MTMVLLNNIDHQSLRVIPRGGREFGDGVNQVMVFPTEFEQVQRELPIVLRPDAEGHLRPVALLGLDRDENLFIGPDGGWQCEHVPVLLQCGPFAIAASGGGGEDRLQVLVDLHHPRISQDEGEPLFLEHGGNAPMLDRMIAALQAAFVGNQLLGPLVEALQAAALLRPLGLELRVGPDRAYTISDALTIDRERLAALSADELAVLHRTGFLQSAFLIAASLGNLQRLVNRKAALLGRAAT
jgi:hypothetical protein